MRSLSAAVALWMTIASIPALASTIQASPETYAGLVRRLQPGDVLRLAPGRYPHGLRLHDLHGAPGRPIAIEGPTGGPVAIFEGHEGRNTISIANASYIEIRNLVLDGRGRAVDAVKAERRDALVHHIVLENLTIVGHGPEQQTVGISTQAPAAFWTIRNNVIAGAGTGLYLGGSDGSAPFVTGLIEGNVIVATTGYNLQIKHQQARPAGIGLPDGRSETILRGNVFSKSGSSSTGPMARPNVLLGHFPLDGAGSDDRYLVEGNVFYGNPTEALLQAEGNLSVEGNLFLNPTGDAVNIQPHNDVPRRVEFRKNFIWAKGFGLRVLGADPRFSQVVEGNESHARMPTAIAQAADAPGFAKNAGGAAAIWLLRARETLPQQKHAALLLALKHACQPLLLEGTRSPALRIIPSESVLCPGRDGAR